MNRSKKSHGIFQPQKLEVDETIFDRNLMITNTSDSGFGELSKPPPPSLLQETCPIVQVTPSPGICVKTNNVENEKVFLNLCKIQEIPPPAPMSEQELQRIIASEDYSTTFKVPMSLGAPRVEKDKSGKSCLACDVAVNSVWFEETMHDSVTFTTFVINLAMEGLCEKYGDKVNLDRQYWTILRNKKYLGSLQRHHIQQRANSQGRGGKILELSNDVDAEDVPDPKSQPKFTIVKDPIESPDRLVTTVELPGQFSASCLTLDVGEDDRLVLETKKYLLDIFLPFRINQDECAAQFDRARHQLTVTTPLLHSDKQNRMK